MWHDGLQLSFSHVVVSICTGIRVLRETCAHSKTRTVLTHSFPRVLGILLNGPPPQLHR